MPRKQDESFIEYRQRLMDPISTSFCAAKWYNATIWLGSGTTTSCHHPLGHQVDPKKVLSNPKLLHNTDHKKEMRRQMLTGTRPKECEYCWKIEDIKRDNVSDRIFKTMIYDESAIAEAGAMDWRQDVNLKTLEIAFDRTCNFACSYCNPAFSTTWANDVRNAPYDGLVSDGRNHFTHPHDGSQPYRTSEENPYVKAFWEWWPELSKTLFELRITGGEPLLSPDVWRMLDFFEHNGSGKMQFALNTNLGAKDELIDKLVAKSHFIENFHIYTSCEAMGVEAEYIRDGLNFDKFLANMEKLITKGNFRSINVMMTINSLCLFSLPQFLDEMVRFKLRYGHDYPVFSLNILRFPSFQSPLVLPDELRMERKKSLEKWFADNSSNPVMHQFELASLQRLIDYLDVVKTPHQDSSSREELARDFKKFFLQYDKRRNKNFTSTFPQQLVQWFEEIKI